MCGLCFPVFSNILRVMAHTENGNIRTANGVRLLTSEGYSPRALAAPRMKGSLTWHTHEPSGPHKGAIVHGLRNSASVHESAVNCFKLDLKGLLEKSCLVFVQHTVDSS